MDIPATFKPVTDKSLKVESLAVLIPVGRLVRFTPLIAGNVAGNLASGIVPDPKLAALSEVRFAPEPEKEVAVTTPALPS